MLAEVRAIVEPDADVRGLMLFGSLARPAEPVDMWTDIDILIVTAAGARGRYFPGMAWLDGLGRVHGWERSEYGPAGVIRTYFDDLRALDLVAVEEPALADLSTWPRHPFGNQRRVIFSRSPLLDEAAAVVTQPPEGSRRAGVALADRATAFRFEAMLAVKKAVRGDLLIASHLALGLQRQCLELALLLRDRDTGTSYHHTGTGRDALASRLDGATPTTVATVLDAIARAALLFDELAAEIDTAYKPGAAPIITMTDAARGGARRVTPKAALPSGLRADLW